MASRENVITATVASLRRSPPPGLDTCYSDGGQIRVVETDLHRTYSIAVPANPSHLDRSGNQWVPEPGSIREAVIREYDRQRLRLELCEARARSATVGTADQGRPVVLSVQPNPDGSVRVTLARPWSREQLAALRKLEKQRAAQVQLEELAAGPQPPETVIIVQLDETGCVDLDSLPQHPAADRAAVLEALADRDPPADTEQAAIRRVLGDSPPAPGEAP